MDKVKQLVFNYRYIIIFWLLARIILFSIRLDTDHSIFYYIADSIKHGGTLYLDAWDHKPPTIFLLAVPFTLLGPNYYLHRVIYSLFNLVATILFFKFSKRFLSTESKLEKGAIQKSTYLATILFILMSLWAGVDGNNNEIWGITIFVLILTISRVKDSALPKWLFIGKYLLYSILITLKPNFMIFLLWEIPQVFVRKNFFKSNLARLVTIMVLPTAYILYYAQLGKLNELWNAWIQFSAGYAAMHNKYFDFNELKNIIFVTIVVMFFFAGLFKLRDKFSKKWNAGILALIVAIYFVYFMFSGTHYEYYILVLTPFLALVIGTLIVTWSKLGKIFLLLLSIYTIGLYIDTVFIGNNMSKWYPVSDHDIFSVSNYIKTHKTANDTCVYFGPTATINIFAECPAPGRFINMTNYMHDIEGGMNNGYLDEFVASLKAKKPRYLIVSALFNYYKYDSRIQQIYDSSRFIYQEGGLEVREFKY
jgi:hypothetical protein